MLYAQLPHLASEVDLGVHLNLVLVMSYKTCGLRRFLLLQFRLSKSLGDEKRTPRLERSQRLGVVLVNGHAPLDQQVAAEVVEPAEVLNFGHSFHIVGSLDAAIDRAFLVERVDL